MDVTSDRITLRLDNDMKRRVASIARRRKTTTSEVLRQAVAAWVEREETSVSVYEQIKDLIGRAHGGDPHASENIGRKYSEYLQARYQESQRKARERKAEREAS
jgi:predicted DNA-binding protein